MPPLYNSLGVYLPLITTNCAVLGVTMLVLEKGAADPTFGYVESLVNAFGAGIGFLVAMVLFAGIGSVWSCATFPKRCGAFPSPSSPLLWWRCPSWALTAWWKVCWAERKERYHERDFIAYPHCSRHWPAGRFDFGHCLYCDGSSQDEKAEAIQEILPGANCGACGYSGCSGYAAALSKGEAKPGLCSPAARDCQGHRRAVGLRRCGSRV